MRCFLTPSTGCKAVCSRCAETFTDADWDGWVELDPETQTCGAPPLRCDHCGTPVDGVTP